MSNDINWLPHAAKALDSHSRQDAIAHQAQLTKPPGALGRLEELAISFAAMQGIIKPKLENIQICVFAGDHGVTAEGVSAFPQSVTAQMVENFVCGGAAISVLAKQLGADLEVVDVGVNATISQYEKVVNKRVVNGTANFAKQAAFSESELASALNAGREVAERALNKNIDLFIGGEMGIGNTTSATALAAVQLGIDAEKLTGPGTGLDASGISHKSLVINQALDLHHDKTKTPLARLQYFAGAEIVALVAAYIRCAQEGVPVLVDGFISSVAALYAQALNHSVSDWFIYSHHSEEPGHKYILEALKARPLLNLNMRLGEGSGAAIAVSVIKNALALHHGMATFAQAGVAEKT